MVPSQECILTVTLTDLTDQRHSLNGTLQLSLKDNWGFTIQSLTYLHVLRINGTGILTSEILTWNQLQLVLIPGTRNTIIRPKQNRTAETLSYPSHWNNKGFHPHIWVHLFPHKLLIWPPCATVLTDVLYNDLIWPPCVTVLTDVLYNDFIWPLRVTVLTAVLYNDFIWLPCVTVLTAVLYNDFIWPPCVTVLYCTMTGISFSSQKNVVCLIWWQHHFSLPWKCTMT